MGLPDDRLRALFGRPVLLPALGIRAPKIQDHVSGSVGTAALCIGIRRAHGLPLDRHVIVVVKAIQVPLGLKRPDAAPAVSHGPLHRVPCPAILVEIQGHAPCRRAPEGKGSSSLRTHGAKSSPIGVLRLKCRILIPFFPRKRGLCHAVILFSAVFAAITFLFYPVTVQMKRRSGASHACSAVWICPVSLMQ